MPLLPTIARDRLIADLTEPLPKVVRIVAPAGYGKTTLARLLGKTVAVCTTVDLAYAKTAIDVSRALIAAFAHVAPEALRAGIAEQSVALGSDEAGWQNLARECLQAIPADMVILENTEMLAGKRVLTELLEEWFYAVPERLHVVICGRVDSGMRVGRIAGPDRSRYVRADDLRFSHREIASVFAELSLRQTQVQEIQQFTRGWPIAVMMLLVLARRGRLRAYLDEDHDTADLYQYLATEVYQFLTPGQRRALEVAAAIPDPRVTDLAAFFGADWSPNELSSLERETPFVNVGVNGMIDVHPAMRQMLNQKIDQDGILAQLFQNIDRADGGLRAAQIALYRNRPDDAASALVASTEAALFATPSPEVNTVLSALPESVLYRHPVLWSAASYTRASQDVLGWISSGERLLRELGPQAPFLQRAGILNVLGFAYINRGRFPDVEPLVNEFQRATPAEFAPVAELIAGFFRSIVTAYLGESIDVEAFQSQFAPLLATTSIRAQCECLLVARMHRLRGELPSARVSLERAIELAIESRDQLVVVVCLLEATFTAWLAGEDELYQRYLKALDDNTTPILEKSSRHFLECAGGRGAAAAIGTEFLEVRANGYLIASSIAGPGREGRRLAREAVVAADQSMHRFARVIARVGLALTDGNDDALREAEAIARETCSGALVAAVEAIRNGDPNRTMLGPLVRRFDRGRPENEATKVVVDFRTRTVAIDRCSETLRPREEALLAFLALQASRVSRDEILRAVWPNANTESAAASFKTYVSRLRRISADSRLIVRDAGRYRLGAKPVVISADGEGQGEPLDWPAWIDRSRAFARR